MGKVSAAEPETFVRPITPLRQKLALFLAKILSVVLVLVLRCLPLGVTVWFVSILLPVENEDDSFDMRDR